MSRKSPQKPSLPAEPPPSIRAEYVSQGVVGYYEQSGGTYRNPHEAAIQAVLRRVVPEWELDLTHVLDLACGSGEVTLALRNFGSGRIDGIDPYTHEAYLARMGAEAEQWTFEQIAEGSLAGRRYSLIVCSFALHLIETSRLPLLLYQLGLICDTLLVLSPHKRPQIKDEWDWLLEKSVVQERIHTRLYRRG